MKALLICPAERPAVQALSGLMPLVTLPILGKSLLEYWLEDLAVRQVREVLVLAADRPDQVQAAIGDGARWGLRVDVLSEADEPEPAAARAKHRGNEASGWLPEPEDVVVIDQLPDLPGLPLFDSCAAWFAALNAWLPRAQTPDRIGLRELIPGVWAGLHARVSSAAELRAPCWLGANVVVESNAVIGPGAILEDRVLVARGAEIERSVVGPDTFVGELTRIADSLAWGNHLIDWRTGTGMEISDRFLLSALKSSPRPAPAGSALGCLTNFLSRAAAHSTAAAGIRRPDHVVAPGARRREKLFAPGVPVSFSAPAGTPSPGETL